MFEATTQIRVRYAETDQMGVVYHGNYFTYFESARAEAIRQFGLTYAQMEAQGIMMPVVEVQCKYIRPVKYDELITIRTTLRELPQGHKIDFHQDVLNEEGQLLASGRVLLYFMDVATRQRTNIPDLLLQYLHPYFKDM